MPRRLALAGCLALSGCAGLGPRAPEERLASDLLSGSEGLSTGAQQALADADADSRRAVARALTTRLCAAAGKDPKAASDIGRALALVGVEAVPGAAASLEERDHDFEMELAAGTPPRDTGKDYAPNLPIPEKEAAARARAFKERDAAIVAELSSAMTALGHGAVFELLSEASENYRTVLPPLRRTAPLMRDVAVAALDSLGEPALPELVDAVRFPRVRAAALRAIGGAGAEGLRVLTKALDSPSPEIRAAAREALAEAVQRTAPAGSDRAEALSAARRRLQRVRASE